MRRIIFIITAFALSLALAAGAQPPGPVADPVSAFAGLTSDARFVVERRSTGLLVGERRAEDPLFELSWEGIASLRTSLGRPAAGEQARVREVVDADGEVVMTLAQTARGARVLTTRAGVLHPLGLHVLLMDNDDLHVADGAGALIYARRTLPEGTLVEQEGADGCQCARTTGVDGQVTVESR